MYYYILDLANAKTYTKLYPEIEAVSTAVQEHVLSKKFSCMNDTYIHELAIDLELSFKETLRDVFVYFLHIEHQVTRSICDGEHYSNLGTRVMSPFAQEYYNLVSECIESKKSGKCDSLSILHQEDIDFLYKNPDEFLYNTKDWTGKSDEQIAEENQRDSKYKQVVILLDKNKEYLGHIYMWSWLNINGIYYGDPFVLEFGGIRTSVRNLLCGTVKNIAPVFVNIVADWASQHGWKYLHVAFSPIGPMPGYLIQCGFNEDNLIKISDLKCKSTHKYQRIHSDSGTDIFSFIEENWQDWLQEKVKEGFELTSNMWFKKDIADNLYTVFIMSYPDRIPSYEELEWLYIMTFRKNVKGYEVENKKDIKELILKPPKNITDYSRFGFYIESLPEGDHKNKLSSWFHSFDSYFKYEKEVQNRIIDLENADLLLQKEINSLEGVSQEQDYITHVISIFVLKIQTQKLISWYIDLITATTQGMSISYDKKIIIGLINDIRRKFDEYDNFSFELKRNSQYNRFVKIMNRVISLP
jgi:hypothetical protein